MNKVSQQKIENEIKKNEEAPKELSNEKELLDFILTSDIKGICLKHARFRLPSVNSLDLDGVWNLTVAKVVSAYRRRGEAWSKPYAKNYIRMAFYQNAISELEHTQKNELVNMRWDLAIFGEKSSCFDSTEDVISMQSYQKRGYLPIEKPTKKDIEQCKDPDILEIFKRTGVLMAQRAA